MTWNITKILKSGCKSVSILTSNFKNLTNLELSKDEIKVSFKVEKIVSSPGDQKFSDLAKARADLRRSMNSRIFFRNKNRDATPFVTKANWNPAIFESM
jgi:hypothetical protein